MIDQGLTSTPTGQAVVAALREPRTIAVPGGEPGLVSVLELADRLRALDADGVVAVGGGSTIDAAKLARGFLACEARTFEDLPEEIVGILPLIAIPTTAGTGAEIGSGAIVYDPAIDDKILVRRRGLAATVALCDPEATATLPPHLTAFTGCDALAQAILAYVPAGWDSVSGQTALRAIRLIYRNLPDAVADGQDRKARRNQMLGSVLSAMAMYNAPPEYAGEHIFAEPIGALLGIHHGHAVAAFLPPMAEFNRKVLCEPFAQIALELGLPGDTDQALADELIRALRAFVLELKVPAVADVVDEYELDELIRKSKSHEAFALNPREISDRDAAAIIAGAFTGSFRVDHESAQRLKRPEG